jgi:two-component system C4-dicarboxylate transport sensor histidine kinase DctB
MAVAGMAGTAGPGGFAASRPARALILLVVLGLIAAGAVAAGRMARDRAAAELAGRAAAAASLAGASLAAVIEKQRLIPMVLAQNPEVIALLASPAPVPRLNAHLDAQLAGIAAEADSAVLYLIDRGGVAVAASNAGTPVSFVGNDYDFRAYFSEAMARGSAQEYALGTVSGRPGLYLAHRVDSQLGPVGVVVAKVEFDPLEARWRDSGLVVQVTDAEGVVLATTEPGWRFGTTRPSADGAAGAQVPVEVLGDGAARIAGRDHVRAATPVGAAAPGWELAVFLPSEPAVGAAARNAQALASLGGLLVAGSGYFMYRRRRWSLARAAALGAMNLELERRVAQRTEELAAEVAERAAAETRARALREELAQANRLSILGQVSAGVAHEINQPLAAIRAYAETGGRLLDAGEVGEARDNLREIVGVAERIGSITQALRGFARRGAGEVRPIVVDEAIDGALTLLAGRIRDAGVEMARERGPAGAAVTAGRIRLEQILVNLLQNALDAVGEAEDPTITITVRAGPQTVVVTVADNGSGVPPAVREQLFMPFTTTKPTGLGLGLVISADIAREFGGELRLEAAGGTGAAFALELPRAA